MKNEIINVPEKVKAWAPALKDFALVDFNQQNFFRTAIMAIQESPQLMECMSTKPGQESLYNAMKRAFSTGLSLNPQEGKAAIIAYKGKASYQIMKEGAVEIVMRSGDVKTLIVEIVFENDEFKIKKTSTGDEYEFSPARKNRGKVDGYFCAITDNKGTSHIKYMTEAEVFEVRDGFSAMFKNKPQFSPWTKSEKGMCKKTVVKAAIRDLYISPSATAQFSSEDQSFFQDQKPEPVDVTPKKTGSSAGDVTKKLEGNQKTEPTEEKAEPGTDRF